MRKYLPLVALLLIGAGQSSPPVPVVNGGTGVTALGPTVCNGGGSLNVCAPVKPLTTSSFTFTAAQMGYTQPMNVSGGGVITIGASGFGSTVFAAGQTSCVINIGTSAATVANSSSATIYPTVTSLPAGATYCFQSDGTNLYVMYGPKP